MQETFIQEKNNYLSTIVSFKDNYGCIMKGIVDKIEISEHGDTLLTVTDGQEFYKIKDTDVILDMDLQKSETKHDPVNHPAHYTDGKIEVIDFIHDKKLNFNRGNAIKYIARAGKKASANLSAKKKEIEDLEKAVFYINYEIKKLKEQLKIEETQEIK